MSQLIRRSGIAPEALRAGAWGGLVTGLVGAAIRAGQESPSAMGVRISGLASCASIDPSRYATSA